MITIEVHRCAYCGGCVSVCPVEALYLAETRLTVSEACIDCGDCVSACPVGALHPPYAEQFPISPPSRRQYDLLVIGAGPGGSTAAQVAAHAGLSVLLLEKRQEIGSPVRCAEGVDSQRLSAFIEPDKRWIAAEISRSEITAVANGEKRTLHAEGGSGYILERRIFDRRLAELASQAGAEVRVKTAATGLLKENGRVSGVKVQHGDFISARGELEIAARLVIAADGVESQVGRWAGSPLQLPLADTMVCAQYLLAGIQIDPSCNLFMIGHDLAPGGYAWVFPKGEAKANVGLGVQADLWERAARSFSPEGEATVLSYLTRFIESDPNLEQGTPVALVAGNVPVGLPPTPMVFDGLMLIGDAARQVDPLTGGGILNAMAAGQLAATVAVEALVAGDTTAAFLSRYDRAWQETSGRKNRRNYRLRDRFSPAERADERFVRLFALAAGG